MSDKIKADLEKSGLTILDMQVRPLQSAERGNCMVAHSTEGYVIPYFTLFGRLEPFYRVRLFDFNPKYKQPKDTPSHVYFPPGFLDAAKTSPYVLLTEGEKKAALATKLGFPTVALGGVDAWRNRTISMPVDAEVKQLKSKVTAKLPAHTEVEESSDGLAHGLQDLIDFIIRHKKHIILCYDSDLDIGIKSSVQRAAANLAFDLRFRGIPFDKIRQIVLPPINQNGVPLPKGIDPKLGLDDFLMGAGDDRFRKLVDACLKKRSAFPRHPAIRDFINRRMQKSNLSRKEIQQLSIGVLSDLDANGIRLRNVAEEQTYYFDFVTRKLFKTTFSERYGDASSTPFGQFLYRRYGISSADKYLITWLAAQFTGEDPVEEVSPHRVVARTSMSEDAVYYQISDSQFVGVTKDGIEIYDNGENGILFESEQVLPLDPARLLREFESQNKVDGPLFNRWSDVLSRVRLRDQNGQRKVTSLLYCLSPWLYRWRGMQLPVELLIGESGSGKSTLCELRLNIVTGDTRLRNSPTDLKDWHASISNTGGLHVTDNVQLLDRSLRQRLSDEICRLITEPSPHIEQRKLYSNAELMRIPIRSVFAITAIQQPFQNADLLQRAIILDLDKSTSLEGGRAAIMYDSEWRANELKAGGGREGWIAYQLVALHRFFKLVAEKWDGTYRAKHRLINFEQSLRLMAEVFGEDHEWIPAYLAGVVDKSLAESDWVFEGIQAFIDHAIEYIEKPNQKKKKPPKLYTAKDICDWAEGHEEFSKCEMLQNARRLGRYLQTHKGLVASSLGWVDKGQRNNKQVYQIVQAD